MAKLLVPEERRLLSGPRSSCAVQGRRFLLHSSRAMQVDDEDERTQYVHWCVCACFRQPLDIPGFDCNRGIYMHKA